jgi:hypothetical protein
MQLMAGPTAIAADGFLTMPEKYARSSDFTWLNFAAVSHGDIPSQLRYHSDRTIETARRR